MRAVSWSPVVSVLALAVAWSPAAQASRAPGSASCALRSEPGPGSRVAPPPADLIAGALWVGVPDPGFAQAQPGSDLAVKTPVIVRARHRAVIRIAASQAGHAGLRYSARAQRARRVGGADRAVRFRACPAGRRRFSDGGVVGPFTFWAGAVMADAPRCVRLETFADGVRRRDLRIPVGRPCD